MSSIRVVDVNNEEASKEVEVKPVIEEAKEEVAPAVEETQPDIKNEVVEKTNEEPKAEHKAEAKAEPKAEAKVKTQDKLITCPKCDKTMKTKSYRYNHEKICQGNLTDRPIKPKAKQQVKPKPEETPTPKPSEINPPQSEKTRLRRRNLCLHRKNTRSQRQLTRLCRTTNYYNSNI